VLKTQEFWEVSPSLTLNGKTNKEINKPNTGANDKAVIYVTTRFNY
jgi:hypothetical protein